MPAHDFHSLRSHLGLPPVERTDDFPNDVELEAAEIAAQPISERPDRTDIPFVTIDPPGSMDLDQAVHLERRGDAIRVHYAIADLGSGLPPGGKVDVEARRRGQTIYLPDGRVPLHPPVLSEGSLSLLPEQVRGAALWTIDLAADGSIVATDVERASVRSVERLDYATVQKSFEDGNPHPSIEALADLGRLRRELRLATGAIDLALPEQEVVLDNSSDGQGWTLRFAPRVEADEWNAEVSLLTGMAAAQLMLDAEVGLLRTLPTPDPKDVETFLALATTLGVEVAEGATPGEVLAGLDPTTPVALALMTNATRLLRGAGYLDFDGETVVPDRAIHAGIGGAYAHVTAPLRRLADRFSTEICLAIAAGEPVPDWARSSLKEVAGVMGESDRRAAEADRTAVDLVEIWLMERRRDETFEAIVVRADDEGASIILLDPPIEARCEGTQPDGQPLVEGSTLSVVVDQIDVEKRAVSYRPA